MTSIIGVVLLLTVALGLSYLKSAQAFSGQGTGTSPTPYLIANCVQLQEMSDDLAADYQLANDIDCSDTANWNGGKGFVPIGDGSGGPFTGEFDGNGHTINYLSMVRADDDPGTVDNANNQEFVGLFGYTNGATVQNVTISHAKIKGYRLVGGIIGRMQGGTLSGSSFNVSTTANDCTDTPANGGECVWATDGQYLGGLVGFMTGSSTISRSHAGGVVKGSSVAVGGLVGYMTGTSSVTDSTASTSVTGSQYVGGAVGYIAVDSVNVQNVYATGSVDALLAGGVDSEPGMYAGGLIGYIADAATVLLSHAKGAVHADVSHAGGFIGYSNGAAVNSSYATGDVSVGYGTLYGSTVGGFAGQLVNGQYYGSYSTGTVTALQGEVGGFVGSINFDQDSTMAYNFTRSPIVAPEAEKGSFFGQVTIDPAAYVVFNYFDRSISGTDVCGYVGGTPINIVDACFAENASGADVAYFYDNEHQPYVDYAHAARTWDTSRWYFSGSALPVHMRELDGPRLDAPSEGQIVKTVPVRISIPFPSLSGSSRVIFSNSDRTISLTLSDLIVETYPLTIDPDNILATDQVVSVSPSVNTIPDGVYTVTFVTQLDYGEGYQPAQSVSVDNVEITRNPMVLCEQPIATNTTIHARCMTTPDEFGVTSWQLRYAVAGTTDYHYVTLANVHDASATISGLTPGTSYNVQFQFTNDWGMGSWATLEALTTGTAPAKNRTQASASLSSATTEVTIVDELPSQDIAKNATPTSQQTDDASDVDTTQPGTVNWIIWIAGGIAVLLVTVGLSVLSLRLRSR